MLKNMYPILLCPTKIEDDYTVFYTPDKEVEVSISIELSTELISICDGTHSIKILIEYFSGRWSEKFLEKNQQRSQLSVQDA